MSSRETQLIQATTLLKEKEEHVEIMQHELNDSKLKFSEAETVVERIVELTNKLVISIKDEDYMSSPFGNMEHKLQQHLLEKPT
ncbi:hypothetical protein L1049_013168 [Liquidambar formosana]|uniref:Uncharacterized protein n=1 Tax=Liquidambar formosana TaxID=63359 RepID=A0AAP0WTV4_LIQFO